MEPLEKDDEGDEDIVEKCYSRTSSYLGTTNEVSLGRRKEDMVCCFLAIILGRCAQKKSRNGKAKKIDC